MSALSPELLYFASRMSGFSTNIFKLETQNQSTATSNSIVAMDLPSNSIINLRSFKMFFECNANAIAAQGGRLPPVKDLVERVEVSMGGVVLSQGTNFVNVLSEAKKAVSAEYCDATLGHPEYIRAVSYVNPADTLATTANENDANTSYCIDEWEGFLGTADPMLFDTSLCPMMRVRCYMATDNVLSSVSTSVLGTAAGNFADSAGTDATTGPPLNSTAVGSPKYALSNIRATIECISIADMTLENMLASQMSAQGELEVPYKAYYSFLDTHTGTSKFSVAASSMDRIWLAWRGSDYNSVTTPITVGGHKVAGAFVDVTVGAGTTTLDIGKPQYDVGGVLDTNNEKYKGRYFNFSQPIAFGTTTAWKAQLQLNGAYYPQFSAGIEEWYGITKNSLPGDRKSKDMTLDQYRDNYCVQCARFNMPNSEFSRSLTGVDTRSTNLQGIVRSESAATGLNPNLSIFIETTEVLKISAGRSISIIV
jgi:hypothetical protein